jgi:hypothetical protein
MSVQEKMNWFWSTGVLPGSVFGDVDDRQAQRPAPRRRSNYLRSVMRKLRSKVDKPKLETR